MKEKRYYSKESKLQSVAMAVERDNISEVARELGIRPDMLGRWIREYNEKKMDAFKEAGNLSKPRNRKLSELQTLKKELKEVKLERDILKKAVHIF